MGSTPDFHKMRLAAGEASQFLRSIANADRLLLLCHLSLGESCVSDLEQQTAIRQPSLSQQLGILRREGLIEPRKEGKHVFYSVADPKVLAMLQQLYELFCNNQGDSE